MKYDDFDYSIDPPSFDFLLGLRRIRQNALPITKMFEAREFLDDVRNEMSDFILTFYRDDYVDKGVQPDPVLRNLITNMNELFQNDPFEYDDEKLSQLTKLTWSQTKFALCQRGLESSDIDVPPILGLDDNKTAERLFSLPVNGIPHDNEFAHSDLHILKLYVSQEHQVGIINVPNYSPVGEEMAPEKKGLRHFQRRRAEICRLLHPLINQENDNLSLHTLNRGANDSYLVLHPMDEDTFSNLYDPNNAILDKISIQVEKLDQLDPRLFMTLHLFSTDRYERFFSPQTIDSDDPQDDIKHYVELRTQPEGVQLNLANDLAGNDTHETGPNGRVIIDREIASKYGPNGKNQFDILADRLGLEKRLEEFYARQIRQLTTTTPPGPNDIVPGGPS
jgi:hypothetical protein